MQISISVALHTACSVEVVASELITEDLSLISGCVLRATGILLISMLIARLRDQKVDRALGHE